MKKELITFYCETCKEGVQGKDLIENPTEYDIGDALRHFREYTNCYLVKIRTYDENNMYSDEVLAKRNIEI